MSGMTNYDRFISKTPEELAKMMEDNGDCPPRACPHDDAGANITRRDCEMCWLEWLKSPVEGET